MIQAMRKKPKTTPATTAPPASVAGMPKTASARAMAMTMPRERGHPDARPERDEHEEEGDDGQGGDGGRQRPRTEGVVVLAPGHGLSGLADYIHRLHNRARSA